MVGLAQALAYAPDLPNRWRKAEAAVAVPTVHWKNRSISGLATMSMTKPQLRSWARARCRNPMPGRRWSWSATGCGWRGAADAIAPGCSAAPLREWIAP